MRAEDSDGVGGLEEFKLEDFGRGIGIGNMDYSLRAGKLPALRSTRRLENVEDSGGRHLVKEIEWTQLET